MIYRDYIKYPRGSMYTIRIMVQVLGEYVIIRYLDP